MKRLFIAIDVPADCKSALLEVNPRLDGLRWMPPDQLHLTLVFLGNVEEPRELRLRESLGGVQVPPFCVSLCGVGFFRARGRPSAVWVGVESVDGQLFALQAQIEDAVRRAGLETGSKPFHPHVTVGRAKGVSRKPLEQFVMSHREAEFGTFEVSGFDLNSSILTADCAVHRVEGHWDLHAGECPGRPPAAPGPPVEPESG